MTYIHIHTHNYAISCKSTVLCCFAGESQNLPFIELDATPGVNTEFLPLQNDGISNMINVSTGFPFANDTQTTVYVSNL